MVVARFVGLGSGGLSMGMIPWSNNLRASEAILSSTLPSSSLLGRLACFASSDGSFFACLETPYHTPFHTECELDKERLCHFRKE